MPQDFGKFNQIKVQNGEFYLEKTMLKGKKEVKIKDTYSMSIMQQELDKLNKETGKNVSINDLLANLGTKKGDDFKYDQWEKIDENNINSIGSGVKFDEGNMTYKDGEIDKIELEKCYYDMTKKRDDFGEFRQIGKNGNNELNMYNVEKVDNKKVVKVDEQANFAMKTELGELNKKFGGDVSLSDLLSSLSKGDGNFGYKYDTEKKDLKIEEPEIEKAYQDIKAKKGKAQTSQKNERIADPNGMNTIIKRKTSTVLQGENCIKEGNSPSNPQGMFQEDRTNDINKKKKQDAKKNKEIQEKNIKDFKERNKHIKESVEKSKEKTNQVNEEKVIAGPVKTNWDRDELKLNPPKINIKQDVVQNTDKKPEDLVEKFVKKGEAINFSGATELFGDKERKLSPEGKNTLKEAFPPELLSKIANNPDIKEMNIYGHTSSAWYGAPGGNEKLSQDRANDTKEYILSLVGNDEDRAKLAEKIVAVGKGSTETKNNPDGTENSKDSRRIEILIKQKVQEEE